MVISKTIDKYDKKILYELDKDGRQSYLKVAKKIKKSEAFVLYRVNRLKKNGIILGTFVILDTSKMGLLTYYLYVQIVDQRKGKIREVINHLRSKPEVWGVNRIIGKFQLYASIYIKSLQELEDLIIELANKFENVIGSYQILQIYKGYSPAHNYLFPEWEWLEHNELRHGSKEIPFSKKERKILTLVMKHPRWSFEKIASEISSTRITVRKVFNELIEKKVLLRIRPSLDATKLGFIHKHVSIKMKFAGMQILDKIKNHLLGLRNTKNLNLTFGEYDIIGRFLFNDLDEFSEFQETLYSKFSQEINHISSEDYYQDIDFDPYEGLEKYW